MQSVVVAVLADSLFARLDRNWVQLGAGVMFIGCAIAMACRNQKPSRIESSGQNAGFARSMWTTFAVIFVAEWGDLTRFGTAALQARYSHWVTVLAESVAAPWAVSATAIFIGNRAARFLPPRVTQTGAAIVFAVVGTVLLVGAVAHL